MLADAIIRIGRPIMNSELPYQERIRMLTDVSSENCKNYFRHVFVIELEADIAELHQLKIGDYDDKKESFKVDQNRNTSFPIFYPNGGNPLEAQGVYPLPCYLMYDPHIKSMDKPEVFARDVLIPRLNNTICYQKLDLEEREKLAEKTAQLLGKASSDFISKEKQLGILMIWDKRLSIYKSLEQRLRSQDNLWIAESRINKGRHLYLDGREALKNIVASKMAEASVLGEMEGGISTFTNEKAERVVSIYNKSWLWLSPTWEMPRSIYWQKDEWTKGIKMDAASYEAFLYGTQFLKQITVPVSNAVLKEMFAPITTAEAKKHMRVTSFEPIFGVPMVLPLADEDSQQLYQKYRSMLKNDGDVSNADLHLNVLAGIDRVIPESGDEHRLTILYYSGDLSRGNMHIRAVIEDILPSVAGEVQKILRRLKGRGLSYLQELLGLKKSESYRTESLPALLANAYGPGYVWSSLQAALHRQPLSVDRLRHTTAQRLNELANKEDHWAMRNELLFYYGFLYFLKRYETDVLKNERSVKELADWEGFIQSYHQGTLTYKEFDRPDTLGFVSGLLLRQFSDSYYHKTNKEFVKNRVMRFGSKLTPVMIWKNGLMRCEELAQQWDMKLAGNFRPVLAQALLGFIEAEKKRWLVSEKETFITAFWSGYLVYHQTKKDEANKEEEVHVNQ